MLSKSLILTLQGRVNRDVFKKLHISATSPNFNRDWFFVDYSVHDVPLGTSFDFLFEGENKKLLRNKSSIRISQILDQFGHKLTTIPEGYKTICKLEFDPDIPPVLKKLPLLSHWKYNLNAINLAQQGIQIGISDHLQKNLYFAAYGLLKTTINKNNFSQNLTKKEFLTLAKQTLDNDSESAEKFLEVSLQLGKVKKKDKKLELVDA